MLEHKTISLAEQVFERLENDILIGKYQRGETLTELKLVTDLGVSRTPVREALHRLEQEHVIEITQKGIHILGVTEQDLKDIFAIRLRLEGMASALAAKNMTAEQLAELKEALELQEFYVGKQDPERIKTMDSRFHQIVYRYCGSAVLNDTLLPLHKKVQKYRRASVEDCSRAQQSAQEHRAIFEAIESKNAALAEQRTTEHIANAANHILNK